MAEQPQRVSTGMWSCPECGSKDRAFAPSGRCVDCESTLDVAPKATRGPLRQIGNVAETVGLSLRSVRFYEEAGLVIPVGRTPGGFRLYDDLSIERLRLIMQMKPLGFTLEEMRLLIEARDRLGAGDVDEAERAKFTGRLEMFAAAAQEKCVELRRQLDVAETFARTLRDDVAWLGP